MTDLSSRLPLSTLATASRVRWAAGLLSLAAMAPLAGCGPEQNAQASTGAGAPPAMPVSVAAVIARPVADEREFSGRV